LGTANEKGTGLGLSFSREYLQMAGGELVIESTIGKGSTLTISIPKKYSTITSALVDRSTSKGSNFSRHSASLQGRRKNKVIPDQ